MAQRNPENKERGITGARREQGGRRHERDEEPFEREERHAIRRRDWDEGHEPERQWEPEPRGWGGVRNPEDRDTRVSRERQSDDWYDRSGRERFGREERFPREDRYPREDRFQREDRFANDRYAREERFPREDRPREGMQRSETSFGSPQPGMEVYRGTQTGGPTGGYYRGPHFGKGPKGWKRSDERIKDDVSQALADSGEVDATDIEIEVQNGDVMLKGTVSNRQMKRQAEDVVDQLPGVVDVQNQLKVVGEAGTVPSAKPQAGGGKSHKGAGSA